jgi:hypothetical protein
MIVFQEIRPRVEEAIHKEGYSGFLILSFEREEDAA